MKLEFGLCNLELGWKRILEQEGLSWNLCSLDKMNHKKPTLFILNEYDLTKEDIENILTYVKNGGLVLTNIKIHSKLDFKIKFKEVYLKEVRGNSEVFYNVENLDIYNKGYISCYSNLDLNILKKYGLGYIFSIPFDLNKVILDNRICYKYFYGGILPVDEKVSLVNKGEVRKFITNIFKYLFKLKNLPYVHLWYYPKKYKTVFAFRIDLDEYYKPHSFNVLNVSKKYNLPITWFINFSNENVREFLDELKKSGQDIQSHSYKHKIYNLFKEDYENILKADKILKKCNINAIGFSTPFGICNDNIILSLEKLRYSYSTDFSVNYEDFPFHPILQNRESSLLQIPIHPICDGRFLMRFYSERNMKKYFSKIIDRFYFREEPIFLYGHPTNKLGKYPGVLSFIFDKIRHLDNVGITTLTEYSIFWKKREKIRYDVIYDDGLTLFTNYKDKDMSFRVILPNKTAKLFDLSKKKYSLESGFVPFFVNVKRLNKNLLGLSISKFLFCIYFIKQGLYSFKKRVFSHKLF